MKLNYTRDKKQDACEEERNGMETGRKFYWEGRSGKESLVGGDFFFQNWIADEGEEESSRVGRKKTGAGKTGKRKKKKWLAH